MLKGRPPPSRTAPLFESLDGWPSPLVEQNRRSNHSTGSLPPRQTASSLDRRRAREGDKGEILVGERAMTKETGGGDSLEEQRKARGLRSVAVVYRGRVADCRIKSKSIEKTKPVSLGRRPRHRNGDSGKVDDDEGVTTREAAVEDGRQYHRSYIAKGEGGPSFDRRWRRWCNEKKRGGNG